LMDLRDVKEYQVKMDLVFPDPKDVKEKKETVVIVVQEDFLAKKVFDTKL